MKNKLKQVKATAKRPINKLRRKGKDPVESAKVPYITNETIAEHREEVLKGARKFIYPLQHSRRKIVWWSLVIFIVTVVTFFTYAALSLYRFESTSTFMYRVTQIIPFPIARAQGRFVSYESYLFELRHYMHYYEAQQKLNFETDEGKEQLEEFKKQAMDQVINDAYIKYLAEENGISVTTQEVDQEIAIVQQQSRLGTSDRMFEDVLRDFWGWSVNDFRRSLRQQILARRVASKLDTNAQSRAQAALQALQNGQSFEDVAKEYSDDEATREAGGEYGIDIDRANRDISARVADAIFSQDPGEISGIIDTGYSLEIVKTISIENGKARAAHIKINLKDINEYIEPIKESSPPTKLLKL